MAQKKEQWFIIAAASLFFIGAVFMLINIFGQEWALWLGFGFLAASILLYLVVKIARVRFQAKYSPRGNEIIVKQPDESETFVPATKTEKAAKKAPSKKKPVAKKGKNKK